jgi:hypothetical protein
VRGGRALRIGLPAAALAAAGALAVLGTAGDDAGGPPSPPVAATATASPAGDERAAATTAAQAADERDAAPVRVPAVIPRLRLAGPARGFAGYPLVVAVRAQAVEDGVPVVIQRTAGGRWEPVADDAVIGGRAAVLVPGLLAGTVRLRARVPAASFAVTSRARTVALRPPRAWRTRGLAGGYRGPRGIRFAVARGGRALTGLRGRVRSVCSGVSAAVRVAGVRVAHARVDPSGRFAGRGRVGGATRIEVRGRLLASGADAVRVRLAAGRCAGATSVRARRAG